MPKLISIDDSMEKVAATFGLKSFSTAQFVNVFKKNEAENWHAIVEKYGEGGKRSGKSYSANSYISQKLKHMADKERLLRLGFRREAPPGWGNEWIQFWTFDRTGAGGTFYPDEADPSISEEGAKLFVTVSRYERDRNLRNICIEIHGVDCAVCGMNFEKFYGEHGAGFIHVHHLNPLSKADKPRQTNAKTDLIPICPNCHAMVHYNGGMLSIGELKSKITTAAKLHPQ